MPVEENGSVGTPISPTQGNQQPGSISDLGDILLDKSLDTVQKNDFVAVTKNDVASLGGEEEEESNPFAKSNETIDVPVTPVVENHATIEDLQNIMLDTPTSESPFAKTTEIAQSPVEETVTETPSNIEENKPSLDIDLGNIDLGNLGQKNSETTNTIQENKPTLTNTSNDVNSLNITIEDINGSNTTAQTSAVDVASIENTAQIVEESSSDDAISNIQLDTVSVETPPIAAPVEEVAPVIEIPVEQPTLSEETVDTNQNNDIQIDTTSLEMPPNIASVEEVAPVIETPIEQSTSSEETVDTNQNNDIQIDTTSLETPTIVAPVEEVTPVIETPAIVEEVIVNNDVAMETPTTIEQNTISSVPETVSQPQNTVEAVALEKVAEEITQGIDLDTLMVEAPATTVQKTEDQIPKETPIEGLKSMVKASNGPQKKVLLGLGAFLVIGLVYFGYMLISDSTPTTPTPIPTNTIDQTSGTDTNETSTDTGLVDTGFVDTGAINNDTGSSSETITGEVNANTGTIENNTGTTTITAPTRDELLNNAKDLAGKVRKALIKATILKNAQMRLSSFTLQQDVDTYIQSLENTNDITTLSDSETKLTSLSQRLDSILQKLNGSSQ